MRKYGVKRAFTVEELPELESAGVPMVHRMMM